MQPIGHRVAAALALAIVGLLGTFIVRGSYTRRATVAGYLEPAGGAVRVVAGAAGTVVALHVHEGEAVEAGRPLVVLSSERQSALGGTQAAIASQLAARRASLERDRALSRARLKQREDATRDRLAGIDIELAQLEREASLHRARSAIAERNVERYERLASTGFVSQAQAQGRIDESLVQKAQVEADGRQRAALARERVALVGQRAESALQAEGEAAELSRAIAQVEQESAENEARRSTVVAAPFAGRTTAITARLGQTVAAGTPLATVIPDGAALEAQLFVGARQVGFVEAGQRVRLRYAAYPYQKFGVGHATIAWVEDSPYALAELPPHVVSALGERRVASEPVYRIVARLDAQTIEAYGRPQPLRSGLLFDADIVQDRRSLYEWLLDPIYGLRGRV